MQKMAQEWFSGGGSSGGGDEQKPASSLLADWNSYAAAQSADDSSMGLGFDLESAVRSANDTVSGTFSVVSKGVRDLPGNLQSATSSVPSGKALMYFGLFLATGVFFVFIAFTMFLPVMVLMPQKFAICFTLGCAFIIGAFFALKGPQNQLAHMISKERLPFTLGFLGSMVGTLYVSMVLHSYILSVFFSVIQVLALAYYAVSYFPGGSAGLKFLSSALTSSVMKCFGRSMSFLHNGFMLYGVIMVRVFLNRVGTWIGTYLAPTIATNLLQAAAKEAVATKTEGPHLGFWGLA